MSLKLGTTDISGVPTTLINTVNNKLDASTYTSNPRTNAVYITQTYHNGASWYRVWSDGFIEQGGTASAGSSTTGSVTAQLLKSYSNTSYSVFCTSAFNGNSYATNVTTKSTSSFTFRYNGSATQTWRACGY